MKQWKNSSGYDASIRYTGGAAAEAAAMKQKILTAADTEEIYEIKGNRYYITRETDLADIPAELQPGDAVLFERGGLWRAGWNKSITVPAGVIFGAYGKGEKPRFYGSAHNYADSSLWEKYSEHIWKRLMKGGNPGIIVFDGTAALGVKIWALEDLKENYDFLYEGEAEDIYLYYDGDPGKDFESIEIGQRGNVFVLENGAVLDNVCVRYGGSHGVDAKRDSRNVTVTNCEIGFIGGSRQFDQVRFGNGIELPLGARNAVIKNNWVYECYDAGITFQSWSSAKLDSYYHDIDISENLVEKCYYGLEYFTTCYESNGLYSEYKNIRFTGNIFRFSGFGWSHEQRPDKWMLSHIRGGQWAYVKETKDFVITDNIFDCSRACIIFWWWHDEKKEFLHPEPHAGLTVRDNVYYQTVTEDKRCMLYHENVPIYAENEKELREAILRFDPEPKKIVLLETV